MKLKRLIVCAVFVPFLTACSYLDVVPDNVATIDYAFRTPLTAEQYLFTCYSWLPSHGNSQTANPAIVGAGEIWYNSYYNESYSAFSIARGNQNVTDPYVDYWNGARGGQHLFRGIRECNIFLENIHRVMEMSQFDKDRMSAEVKALKAYYHFWLMRMYGPIPIIRDNTDVAAELSEIQGLIRQPIDECVEYIVQLLDEAAEVLPMEVFFEVTEKGRMTKPIALAIKAQVLVTAASPLFNGNQLFASYTRGDGTPLFNIQYSDAKWERAAEACREAIEVCHEAGFALNYFTTAQSPHNISEFTATELSIRTTITQRWNSEVIWGNPNSMVSAFQTHCYPRIFSGAANYFGGHASAPMHVVEQFYSENGVPINEDITYDYENRHSLRTATEEEKVQIMAGYTTASMNFGRETRFYATLAFDGSRWYGQGLLSDDENHYITARQGGAASGHAYSYSVTGYWPKKIVNYLNTAAATQWTIQPYPWPVIRLADLYLLYAEALNEAYGPSDDVYEWLNRIRDRAALPTVQEAWSNYSIRSDKYLNKNGLREIIHQERAIELVFEGSRFWDVRRWMTASNELNRPIVGWDIHQETPEAYYRERVIDSRTFGVRDYFWPIRERELLINSAVMQSPGW